MGEAATGTQHGFCNHNSILAEGRRCPVPGGVHGFCGGGRGGCWGGGWGGGRGGGGKNNRGFKQRQQAVDVYG